MHSFAANTTVSASFVAGADANSTRQRHAPLYGRLVAEEHLPPTHRDAVHQVSFHLYIVLLHEARKVARVRVCNGDTWNDNHIGNVSI